MNDSKKWKNEKIILYLIVFINKINFLSQVSPEDSMRGKIETLVTPQNNYLK